MNYRINSLEFRFAGEVGLNLTSRKTIILTGEIFFERNPNHFNIKICDRIQVRTGDAGHKWLGRGTLVVLFISPTYATWMLYLANCFVGWWVGLDFWIGHAIGMRPCTIGTIRLEISQNALHAD